MCSKQYDDDDDNGEMLLRERWVGNALGSEIHS